MWIAELESRIDKDPFLEESEKDKELIPETRNAQPETFFET